MRAAGIVNEVQGLILHDIPNLPSRLSGETPWAFQIDDIRANEVGIQRAIGQRRLESGGQMQRSRR